MNEEIVSLLKERYGDFNLLQLTGGYTNQSFMLKGIHPPLVVKVADALNQEVDNEINCLKLLQETGIVPKLYDFFETTESKIIVMEYRNGINGQSILDIQDLENIKTLYKNLGESLANSIHSKKYPFTANGIKECTIEDIDLHLNFVPTELISKSGECLSQLKDIKEDWVLTHGDYGVHNVLYNENHALTILDWEWSEWANPITDIAWVCWFTKLHYPEYADLLNQLFIEEYNMHNPVYLSSELIKGYCTYRVWKVLHRVKNGRQEVKEEWIRRLRWTLDTDFIPLSMK